MCVVISACSIVPVDQSEKAESKHRYPVLEIWIEKDGSVPIRGKSLYFRLYDDGNSEFDHEIEKDIYEDGIRKRKDYSLKRTSLTQLSPEEFREFELTLKKLADSKDVKPEYERVGKIFDTSAKIAIDLKQNGAGKKRIVLNDFDAMIVELEDSNAFPESITRLFKKIRLIRKRLINQHKICELGLLCHL